jgi:signal transduction histidine kinase
MNSLQTSISRWIYRDRNRYRLLGLSFLALHLGIALDLPTSLRAAFIFVHFGLFLLWQPFWHRAIDVSPRSATLVLIAAAAVVIWPSWLPVAIWLLLLLGLLGGEFADEPVARTAQLLAIGFLLMELLLGVNPQLFALEGVDPRLIEVAAVIATLPPLLLLLMRAREQPPDEVRVDYLRSFVITLFGLMLAAGSVLWMYRAQISYPVALLETLIAASIFIIASNWVWRQQSSHSIFQIMWNRYLLNLGTPFERYLMTLADKNTYSLPAAEYLDKAMRDLARLEWVVGIAWKAEGDADERVMGTRTAFHTEVPADDLCITVYTARKVAPTFVLHIHLLARLTAQFYLARKHTQLLKKRSHLQAVYETGSRLTHDIKNLLQSMQSLSAAVEHSSPEDAEAALALLKRQMPEINRRLQLTLDKLKQPNVVADSAVPLDDWWESLNERHHDQPIIFRGNVLDSVPVPKELFDNVADNLLDNALYKLQMSKELSIYVTLTYVAGHISLTVCDTGDAVADDVAKDLFRETVRSKRGLGIGLYHCQELANRYGYTLSLKDNRPGKVCFALYGAANPS